jgi:hypothetical protein
MASIIEQIQRDALDRTVPVSTLLRRVKLAASKLDLGAVEDWVDQELNGYSGEVPDYRVLHGQPMARNPFRGWQPVGGSVEALSKRANGQSVAVIEDALADAQNDTSFQVRYSDAICRRLDEQNGVAGWTWALQVPRNQFAGILDRVRNLVLEWAINLERLGVLGSDFSFDATEKQKAQASSMTFNIGSIHSFTGNLGQGNVTGDVSVDNSSMIQVRGLVSQLKQHIEELIAAGADRGRLEDRIALLEAELRKTSPDRSLVRGLLTDLRNALVAATSSLVASGAVHLLNQILGTPTP